MKPKQILSGIFLMFFLVGCVFAPSLQATSSTLPTEPGIIVSQTVDLRTKTSDKLVKELPTSTPEPTIQPTSISPTKPSIPRCEGGSAPVPLPDNLEFPGTIMVDDGEKGKLLGGTPLKSSRLPILESQDIEFFGFSPDGKWLAYSPYNKYQTEPRLESMTVVLLSSDGERIEHTLDIIHSLPQFGKTMYPNGLPVYWFGQWMNDSLLYVQIHYLEAEGITKTVRLQAVFDPFQGLWRNELLDNFPPEYPYLVGISPDLARILYVWEDPMGVVLWDIEQEKKIWGDLAFRSSTSAVFIRWSPDSSKVVYFNQLWTGSDANVYLATRDGEERIIITDSTYPIPDFHSTFAQWTPDGRYLAIVQSRQQPDTLQTVYVYDTVEEKFTYQCAIHGFFNGLPGLHWSPDGKYLASFSASDIEKDNPIYVIDFEKELVYELAQKGQVVGWSRAFPLTKP